jgi:hypothetical protein
MVMYILNSTIDFPITRYYFKTFIVESYSSVPHLVRDLLQLKQIAYNSISPSNVSYRNEELKLLINMIEAELANYNTDIELAELEENEPIYWINRLGRQSALEISTYGRIRPETMNLLMYLPEDDFQIALSIAGRLSSKIQAMGEQSLSQETPLPPTMPIVS